MSQGLQTSDSLPVFPKQTITNVSHSHDANTSAIVTIDTSSVVHSVCETILNTSCVSSGHTPTSSTILVVSSPTSVTGTQSATQYRISEIIDKEKDLLFQSSKVSDIELEPARQGLCSVRRRSRQFFTLLEEDEDSEVISKLDLATLDQPEKTIKVEPVFNLGDSLKRLYFPHHHQRNSRQQKHRESKAGRQRVEKGKIRSSSCGYDSDSAVSEISLTDIINNDPTLKNFNSHPDLSESEQVFAQETFAIGKSKSLPVTPRVSPKLIKRKLSKTDDQVEVQKQGSGLSFLASVAGELRRNKMVQEQKSQKQLSKPHESQVTAKMGSEVVKQDTSPVKNEKHHTFVAHSSKVSRHDNHDFSHVDFEPDSAPQREAKHKGKLMESLIQWGTQTRVSVTNKDANVFSPSSF